MPSDTRLAEPGEVGRPADQPDRRRAGHHHPDGALDGAGGPLADQALPGQPDRADDDHRGQVGEVDRVAEAGDQPVHGAGQPGQDALARRRLVDGDGDPVQGLGRVEHHARRRCCRSATSCPSTAGRRRPRTARPCRSCRTAWAAGLPPAAGGRISASMPPFAGSGAGTDGWQMLLRSPIRPLDPAVQKPSSPPMSPIPGTEQMPVAAGAAGSDACCGAGRHGCLHGALASDACCRGGWAATVTAVPRPAWPRRTAAGCRARARRAPRR